MEKKYHFRFLRFGIYWKTRLQRFHCRWIM